MFTRFGFMSMLFIGMVYQVFINEFSSIDPLHSNGNVALYNVHHVYNEGT